jgi:hypothetical protein
MTNLIVLDGDRARTRRTDPTTSHQAADVSQRTLKAAKVAILRIIHNNPGVTGTDLNDLYLFFRARHTWVPVIAWDSPRKRAGELVDDGYLVAEMSGRRGANNQTEHTYRLTEHGQRILEIGKQADS